MEPVVITGLGAISCLGRGVEAFWRGLGAASSRPRRARDPYAHMERPLMYAVPQCDVPANGLRLDGVPLGRASRFAVEAARQAVREAALDAGASARVGVVMGTGMGDAGLHEQWRVDDALTEAAWAPAHLVAAAVGDALGAVGAVSSISNACAASGFAISVGADMVRCGEADVVVAGGAEGYSRVALACFNRLGAIDPLRCRPFDARRGGTVFGEGAGAVVLESESHALRRGAPRPYARLSGAGWSCDAHHPTAPEPSGEQIVRAMRQAIRDSAAPVDDVACVVPHGTGTQLNDVVESRALHQVLGPRCPDVPLYSLKALIGHTGGAAGALATVAAALILHRGETPPNAPVEDQDPDCDVWLPQHDATRLDGGHVLVNAYAFGGNNVSLLLEGTSP